MTARKLWNTPQDRWTARPRLSPFETTPRGDVVMLVAPPGSGKSILMGQWAAGRNPCWLTMSDAHNDGFILARDITATLHAAHDAFDLGIGRLAMNGGASLGKAFIEAVASELDDLAVPVLLVLDDLHEVTDADLLADVGQLILAVPNNVRVLVASRWDLPLGLGRMRLQGDLVELRAADLAFDLGEAVAMLGAASGRAITPQQAQALVDRTEGWAAGLQLAALSLAEGENIDDFIERFAGDDRLIVDYLTDTILQLLPLRTRSFLLQVSVLEWMTPELCEAVTGDEDARATLLSLADHGFFLTREGASTERFRLHQLIAEVMSYQLAVEDHTAAADCRRRAATWLLSHHEYESGVKQLLAAGEHRQAFEVLAAEGHRLFEDGATATLVNALAQVQEAMGAADIDVAIHLLAAQVTADEYIAAADTYRHLAKRDLTRGQRIAIDVLASVMGQGHLPLEEVRRLAEGAGRSLSEAEPTSVPDFLGFGGNESCATVAGYCSAMATFLMGDLEGSATELVSVLDSPGAKYPLWRINLLGFLSLVRAWQGQLNDAEALALDALDAAQEVGAMAHVDTFCAQLSLATINVDRLHFGRAGMHLDAAASAAQRCRRANYDQLLLVLRVRYLAVTESAESALDHLRNAPTRGMLRPLVRQNLSALQSHLLLRSGSVKEAQRLLASGRSASPAVSIDVLLANGAVDRAKEVLASWHPLASDLRTSLQRDLRRATVTYRDGHQGVAGTLVADAAQRADAEGLLEPFVDAPVVLGLLRTAAPVRRLRRLGALLDDTLPVSVRGGGSGQLIEKLTSRELTVLEYLPSRLGNDQIADALYVSVNTLKTHLRNIYRKLDAEGRDSAVQRAGSLGLI